VRPVSSRGGDPTISVIVPATGTHPTLARCVAAIRASADPPDELIVVTEPAEAGPAAARNEGADRASGDVLAFVDADVVVHGDALALIRGAFAADPALTAIVGSYDDSPPARGAVSGFRNLLHHHVHQQAGGASETFWAGLGAIRRPDFMRAKGFDARAFPHASIEDVELGMRLTGHGARIRLDPTIQGTHLKRWTLREMLLSDFARRGMPWVALLLRSRALPRHLNLGWTHRLSAAASLLGILALARRRPAAAAAFGISLVYLNRSLYLLILRRRGPAEAVAAVGIHVLHHLAAVASVLPGALSHALGAGRRARSIRTSGAQAGDRRQA
jgi:GT2 family glycosyltransferase